MEGPKDKNNWQRGKSHVKSTGSAWCVDAREKWTASALQLYFSPTVEDPGRKGKKSYQLAYLDSASGHLSLVISFDDSSGG